MVLANKGHYIIKQCEDNVNEATLKTEMKVHGYCT